MCPGPSFPLDSFHEKEFFWAELGMVQAAGEDAREALRCIQCHSCFLLLSLQTELTDSERSLEFCCSDQNSRNAVLVPTEAAERGAMLPN